MKKYHKNTNILPVLLMLIFLLIGIGYAYLSSSLSINGSTTVSSNTWDIHFANIQVAEGSVPIGDGRQAATIDNQDNTLITYSILLGKPGDYYEFTADIVNAGQIDGMIESINSKVNNQAITNLPSYIEYSLTYSDGKTIAPYHLLSAGATENIKVRVGYKADISNNELVGTYTSLEFALDLSYLQADENGVEVSHKFTGIKYATNRHAEEGYVYIDRSMPIGMRFFDNPSDAKADYFNNPFYLKYVIEEDIVKESYVCFELENNTYCLRGEHVTDYDEVNDSQICRRDVIPDCTNPYYEDNVDILLEAFGTSFCTQYDTFILCSMGDLRAVAYLDGNLFTAVGSYTCGVNPDSSTDCSTQ